MNAALLGFLVGRSRGDDGRTARDARDDATARGDVAIVGRARVASARVERRVDARARDARRAVFRRGDARAFRLHPTSSRAREKNTSAERSRTLRGYVLRPQTSACPYGREEVPSS